MTPADTARLELAKRAYRATQPTELEVQTGVRRARLSLRRGRSRSKWWLKGVVFVVLALGSLAYAKPHALADLIERGAPWRDERDHQPAKALASQHDEQEAPSLPIAATPVATAPSIAATATAPAKAARVARRTALPAPLPVATATGESAPAEPQTAEAPVSEWGRVGQALARGDETSALDALGKLAASDDPRTRDKADLGRAQLMMAHGNRDGACALARSLTQRRSGSRIERQAQVLLKDCAR